MLFSLKILQTYYITPMELLIKQEVRFWAELSSAFSVVHIDAAGEVYLVVLGRPKSITNHLFFYFTGHTFLREETNLNLFFSPSKGKKSFSHWLGSISPNLLFAVSLFLPLDLYHTFWGYFMVSCSQFPWDFAIPLLDRNPSFLVKMTLYILLYSMF